MSFNNATNFIKYSNMDNEKIYFKKFARLGLSIGWSGQMAKNHFKNQIF